MSRGFYNQRSLGKELNVKVKQASVLLVGAGGIGCELLKDLLLTGYGSITVVDLDTIDLSNLNRQFLFRHEHIKKSKALVAVEVAQAFNPNVKLVAHHANIKEPQFNVEWFKSFRIVFNALDNLDARRHVNRMCLAADVPLIESGTTGFNGNVQVIKKGKTACYDCVPKDTPTTFPVCTIRSTPSQPIHCIVWGKSYLLPEVFGASETDGDSDGMDHTEDSENAEEIRKLKEESQALKRIRDNIGKPDFTQLLFDKVYKEDVDRLRSMEEMWKTRRRPDPLDYATLAANAKPLEAQKLKILRNGQKTWTLEENLIVFKDSLERLSKRFQDEEASAKPDSPAPVITFDKDDEDTLDFVAASANIRSIIFGIDTKSRFDIKQMAGNIIPAIATTNAITAGLCVLQSFKVLQDKYDDVKDLFLGHGSVARLINPDPAQKPNPDCPVCSVAQTQLLVDFSRATLSDVVEDFLRLQLGYGEEFVVSNEIGPLYDVDETENLSKKLSELGINRDSFLQVIDEDEENPRVNLLISLHETDDLEKPVKPADDAFSGEQIPRKPEKKPSEIGANGFGSHKEAASNGLIGHPVLEPASAKRKADDNELVELPAKKARAGPTADSEVITIDDADGSILIE